MARTSDSRFWSCRYNPKLYYQLSCSEVDDPTLGPTATTALNLWQKSFAFRSLDYVWFEARTHTDCPPIQWHDDDGEIEDDLSEEEVGL